MNAKTLFAAVIAFVGTAAFAQEVQNFPPQSTLTRAQVKAELSTYAGRPSSEADVFASVRDGKLSGTAAQSARAEVRRSLMSGTHTTTVVGESYGTVVPGTGSTLSREAVRAETLAAMQVRQPGRYVD